MNISIALLLLMVTAVSLPPLTHEQQVRLDTARDGRDHREEAFIALIENARQAKADGDETIHSARNIDAMIAAPDQYRGALIRLSGRLEQRTSLGPLYESIEEWFVRDADDRPVIVFIVDAPVGDRWREGRDVTVLARFYKRIDATDRRGIAQQYAAFVGSRPQLVRQPSVTMELWVLLLPIVFLLIAFALVLVYVRRQRGAPRFVRRPVAETELDEPGPLPDDPASALAELRRRAE